MSVKCNLLFMLTLCFLANAFGIENSDLDINNYGEQKGVSLNNRFFGRPLQWCVFMLHANELLLRHLFMSLDGSTSGPKAYSGVIGKQLAVCETKTPVSFCAVAGNLPELPENVVNELSTDQSYLYEMCQAIIGGSCSPDLASRQPGKMVHSRWLTTANRILRLYGPYSLKLDKMVVCKGSKPPCGAVEILNTNNLTNIIFSMNFSKDCVIGMVRITMSSTPRNGQKSKAQVVNYNIDKPCQHFVFGPVLRQAYGDEALRKCIVPKGNYTRSFNLVRLSELFFGPKFFYGTYKFLVTTNNKKYHILCYKNVMEINPLT